MRMPPVAIAVAVLVSLAKPALAGAQTVAVLPPSGVNVEDGTLSAAQDILRGHLAHTGRFHTVVALAGEVGGREVGPQAAIGLARGAGVDLAVVLHLTRLGTNAQVRMTTYAAATGAIVYADRMTAASTDDVDRVLERLAQGMASGRPGAETAELQTVTQAEARAPLKRAATHVFGVGLGAVAPNGGGAAPGLQIYWMYDARSFLADITLGFHADGKDNDLALGIGAYYPLAAADFTPYIGGGARWATTEYADARGHGIQLYAALGGILGRLGSVQLRGQLEYFVDTFRSQRSDWSYSDVSQTSTVTEVDSIGHGLGVTVGLGF
jgi:hypothetical protein